MRICFAHGNYHGKFFTSFIVVLQLYCVLTYELAKDMYCPSQKATILSNDAEGMVLPPAYCRFLLVAVFFVSNAFNTFCLISSTGLLSSIFMLQRARVLVS
jgi:hypothetical protein